MGHIIERIAQGRGHDVVCRIDIENQEAFDSEAFKGSDVAIEFTTPATAEGNVRRCLEAGVPVVSGTTGWTDAMEDVRQECERLGGAFMWSSNYSIGVALFRRLNESLTRMMNSQPQYSACLEETHHIHKLDHPSGTAVTLANDLVAASTRYDGWQERGKGESVPDDILPVEHVRRGEVPGIHTIQWDSNVDAITITHSAKSREGFALGAVVAAEFLAGKKGCHDFSEVIQFD